MAELEAPIDGKGLRVAIIVARWNGFITRKLLEGARSALGESGVASADITIAWVPGSFEVPLAAKWAAASGKHDAVIGLGCVIRGDTAHFDYVAGGAATGIGDVGLQTGVPVVFGVLTVETVEQAVERTGGKEGHKGEEAARTAIEMANLKRLLA